MGNLMLGKFAREHLRYSSLSYLKNVRKPYQNIKSNVEERAEKLPH